MSHKTEPPIVIYGSGRSGTTWIQDVIAESNGYRTLFEPLHPAAVKGASQYANRYLNANTDAPVLKRLLDPVFSGDTGSLWMCFRQRPDRLLPDWSALRDRRQAAALVSRYRNLWNNFRRYSRYSSERLVIKFIRANLMIDWISAHYRQRSIFVVRHPGAVVESQIRQGEQWDSGALRVMLDDALLNAEYLKPYRAFLSGPLDQVQAQTAIWCIQNVLPLRRCESLGVPVIYYERLLLDPREQWQLLQSALDLPHIPDREQLSKPSQQASGRADRKLSADAVVGRWQRNLSPARSDAIQEVLDKFGVTNYCIREIMPVQST